MTRSHFISVCSTKMKVFAYLLMSFVLVNAISVKPFSSNFDVIIEIVGNYLQKFISQRTSVLSIVAGSSSIQQKYLQNDLIGQFIINWKISNFSFNFLNTVHQKRRKNKQTFNLIFIDGSSALV